MSATPGISGEHSVPQGEQKLLRALGLWQASSIVVGIMIGSAIFIVPADITREVGGPRAGLAVWAVGDCSACLARSRLRNWRP